ncbi:hypothetical protein BGX38DRAFT_422772 [Terfezia claveryi]|nr:hypothetical protein BGX38DRAFT_422772 [Terfezia claveryi]
MSTMPGDGILPFVQYILRMRADLDRIINALQKQGLLDEMPTTLSQTPQQSIDTGAMNIETVPGTIEASIEASIKVAEQIAQVSIDMGAMNMETVPGAIEASVKVAEQIPQASMFVIRNSKHQPIANINASYSDAGAMSKETFSGAIEDSIKAEQSPEQSMFVIPNS